MIEHSDYMRLALSEAEKAFAQNEVPIGAVLVSEEGKIISRNYNQTITRLDPTAHAEILAIRQAAQLLKNYRLLNTVLYVTLEPCAMCMGAIIHARITKLVFGSFDEKWGAAGSIYNFAEDKRLNHHPEIVSGILDMECRQIIQSFFVEKRVRQRMAKMHLKQSIE